MNKTPKNPAQVSIRTEKRRIPKQERALITVEAILEAAAELLCEIGYAATTTNAIAKRAGVSIGSLYQYYPDKDAIYRDIVAWHRREMEPISRKAAKDLYDGRAIPEVLEEALKTSLEVRRGNPDLMTAIHEQLAGLGQVHDDAGARKPVWEAIAETLDTRRDVKTDHLRERAWLVTAIMETVARSLVHRRMPDLDQVVLCALTRDACSSLLADRNGN